MLSQMNKHSKNKIDFNEENNKIFNWVARVMFLIIISLVLINQPWRNRGCYLNEKSIFEREFKGRVIDKFINYSDHANETLTFNSNRKVALLRGAYYKNIAIGDSIHKIKNSFKLEVHKSDTIILMIYKLPCDEQGPFYFEANDYMKSQN